jgi:DNA-3-methyladenine glycosylase
MTSAITTPKSKIHNHIMSHLARSFFARPTLEVAWMLLGQRLVRIYNGRRLAGIITETEAYIGEEDLACHARAGRTARTQVMYYPGGHAYVYFTYGMHWMLNFVTEGEGFPAAVLVRAIVPVEGETMMRRLRGGKPASVLTDGPAKLTQALAIDSRLNGVDICASGAALFVEKVLPSLPEAQVTSGPRVGIDRVPEPWKSQPWNFRLNREG